MSQEIRRFHEERGSSPDSRVSYSSLEVEDNSVVIDACSFALLGTSIGDYSSLTLEPLVWITGNFASDSEPKNPLLGQTWYDTSSKTIKIYNGNDKEGGDNNWISVTVGDISDVLSQDVIPNTDALHKIGSESKVWDNAYTTNIFGYDSFTIGDNSILDILPSTSDDISNLSAVPGDSVSDAINYLNSNSQAGSTMSIVTISQEGGTYNLVPSVNTRYRFTSHTPITVTIEPSAAISGSFELFAVGDVVDITDSIGVDLDFYRDSSTSHSAYFTLTEANNWRVF